MTPPLDHTRQVPLSAATLRAAYRSLEGLPVELERELITVGHLVRAAEGERFFDEGSAAERAALVLAGRIRVCRRVASGREVLLYRVAPGELCVMTVTALLADVRYEAAATAETDLLAFVVPRALFRRLVDAHPPLRQAVFATYAARIAQLMGLVDEMTSARLDQRVAALLARHGRATVHTTHQHLADELATAREVVSRILESFAAGGLVHLTRGSVEIIDPQGLADIAHHGP